MKKIVGIILSFVFILALINPAVAKRIYRTYEVIEVTGKTIVLQRKIEDGELLTLTIDRSKQPNLKVGDRVRYDKNKKRVGSIVPSK